LAKCRQLAPRVEAENTCCDDRGKVEDAEKSTADCSQASNMVAATAEKHPEGVEGQEEHRDATEYVNFTITISSIIAICTASTVFHNIFKVLLDVFHIIRAVKVLLILVKLLVKDVLVKHHHVKHVGIPPDIVLSKAALGKHLVFKVFHW